jgi:hypothetical protein
MRRSLLAAPVFFFLACGGSNAGRPGGNGPGGETPDGGASSDGGVLVAPDGGVVVSPDGGAVVIPPTDPQIRFVSPGNDTIRVDPRTMQSSTVLARSYPGLTRTRDENSWDLFDPVTGRYIAQYQGNGGQFLWSVNGDAPQKVSFDGASSIFDDVISWGVMSADGQRIYLSTGGGAYVATRKSAKLEFSSPVALGHGVKIVHDVSRDDTRAVVSGNRPIKWGVAMNIVAPRQVSIFALNADGTLGADETSDYAPLASNYIEVPSFLSDSTTLLYEGDDDIDTGDRLFLLAPGGQEKEIFPQPLSAQDFNTPCALPDDRVVFWESDAHIYTLRMFDPKANQTVTAYNVSQAFTGYIRCR